jgi:hypothetical protein
MSRAGTVVGETARRAVARRYFVFSGVIIMGWE